MSSIAKKVLLGVSLVAVLGIGYFAVKGYPPVGEDGKGTIGTAQRYRAPQMANQDVVLENPEAQQWMQTDSFHRLINDPVARKALASPEFRALVVPPGRRTAIGSCVAIALAAAGLVDLEAIIRGLEQMALLVG